MASTTETVPGGQLIITTDAKGSTVQFVPDAGTSGANQQTVTARAEANIARLTQIVNAASWTAAQRDAAIKDIAKAIRDLTRLALGRLDSAD